MRLSDRIMYMIVWKNIWLDMISVIYNANISNNKKKASLPVSIHLIQYKAFHAMYIISKPVFVFYSSSLCQHYPTNLLNSFHLFLSLYLCHILPCIKCVRLLVIKKVKPHPFVTDKDKQLTDLGLKDVLTSEKVPLLSLRGS